MSDIPDSISAEALQQFIRKVPTEDLPGADQFPSLHYGGTLGGCCDLQYAILLLVQRSKDGVNIAQVLAAAMHLLNVASYHFESSCDRLESSNPDLAGITAQELQFLRKTMRSQARDVRDAMRAVDAVLQLLGPALNQQRASALVRDVPKGAVIDSTDFFSRILISDEFIESLGIDRASMASFIKEQLDGLQ